jgi:hypothetical protein
VTDDAFLDAFHTGRLHGQWNHEAHVRMAYLYFVAFGIQEAPAKIATGIQRFNQLRGFPKGYHETITVAFCRLVASRFRVETDWETFRVAHPELLTMAILECHYSRARLFSQEAETMFLPPDRKPL